MTEHGEIPDIEESVDEAEREVRISSEEGDNLPVTPADQQSRIPDDGPDEETIDQRVQQEVPEEGTAYGDAGSVLDESSPERLGGKDPGSILVEEDNLGNTETS